MKHVYMTQCSLIRTYHQMDSVRREAPVVSERTSLLEWLKGLAEPLRDDAPARKADERPETE